MLFSQHLMVLQYIDTVYRLPDFWNRFSKTFRISPNRDQFTMFHYIFTLLKFLCEISRISCVRNLTWGLCAGSCPTLKKKSENIQKLFQLGGILSRINRVAAVHVPWNCSNSFVIFLFFLFYTRFCGPGHFSMTSIRCYFQVSM
jgi:hypothetical protein